MSGQQVAVNRTLVGIIAVVCLLAGATIYLMDSYQNVWCGAFVRTGLLMGAFWLALPTGNREAAWANVSPWVLVVAVVVILLLVRRPRVFFPLLIAIGIVAFFLRPRPRRR
ncbi:MAG: hypothetical protein ACF8PG_15670 [Maioricimonas sp. JB045]|uniref:hypothetical protein n=1 Tax=Maioricimonas sp. JC845 TaxID=3232138 RepID=UPI00345A7C74